MIKQCFLIIVYLLSVSYNYASRWYVGQARSYTMPGQVSGLVNDGDTVYIDGGVYLNDAVKWTKKGLRIIGLGTEANPSVLRYSVDIPNGKGIFVFEVPGSSDNPYIENLVFDGAQVSDANGANGAGVRFQAENITINKCKFLNCQNGILEGSSSVNSSNVIIMNSEFHNNGYQEQNNTSFSGYEHHIYISASADTLIVMNCWFHHPRGQGNSIKTRAQRSFILYNLIDEEDDGYGSYEINIAQGGLNVIMGNIIIQGPAGANHAMIGYDAVINPLEDFYFVNNTVINRFAGNLKYFNIAPVSGINTFKIYNNIFATVPSANNTFISGNAPVILDTAGNTFSSDYMNFGFLDPSSADYSLTSAALAAIDMGAVAGNTGTGFSLTPLFMYKSNEDDLFPRILTGGSIDIGAYEYLATGETSLFVLPEFHIFPNPGTDLIAVKSGKYNSGKEFIIVDLYGREMMRDILTGPQVNFNIKHLNSGVYIIILSEFGRTITTAKFIKM